MATLRRITLHKETTSTCKKFRKLSIEEAAYLAGLIDGEGCLSIYPRSRKRVITYKINIDIGMTTDILIDFCNKYGGCHYRQEAHDNKKAVFYWKLNIQECVHYLPQIFPYMKVKKAEAKILLEALKTLKNRQRYKLDDTVRKQMEQYCQEIKALHKQ